MLALVPESLKSIITTTNRDIGSNYCDDDYNDLFDSLFDTILCIHVYRKQMGGLCNLYLLHACLWQQRWKNLLFHLSWTFRYKYISSIGIERYKINLVTKK